MQAELPLPQVACSLVEINIHAPLNPLLNHNLLTFQLFKDILRQPLIFLI